MYYIERKLLLNIQLYIERIKIFNKYFRISVTLICFYIL